MAIKQTKTEQELLFEERTGEKFSFLYEKFNPRLVYYINNMLNDQHLSEDVATEAFIKAFEKIDQYEKSKAQFSTWIFTIARHIAIQELKSSKKTMSIDTELDNEGTTMKDFIQDEETNDEFLHTLNNKKAEILKKYISELKQPYRNVIEMREIHEMQYKDIACAMGKDIQIKIFYNKNMVALPIEISKCYKILDINGNEVKFELIKGKEFYEFLKIEGDFGEYELFAREPKNLSTIKSQIRNSRNLLMKYSKKEFDSLDEMYL